jgi:hypothetical protein
MERSGPDKRVPPRRGRDDRVPPKSGPGKQGPSRIGGVRLLCPGNCQNHCGLSASFQAYWSMTLADHAWPFIKENEKPDRQ